MNKARREFCQKKIAEGLTPKQAYEESKKIKDTFSHAIKVGGALVRKKKV